MSEEPFVLYVTDPLLAGAVLWLAFVVANLHPVPKTRLTLSVGTFVLIVAILVTRNV